MIFGGFALGAYLAKGGRAGRLGLVATVITIVANSMALAITGWSSFAAPAIGRAYRAGMEDSYRYMSIQVQLQRLIVHQLYVEYPVVLDLLSLFHQSQYLLWQELGL